MKTPMMTVLVCGLLLAAPSLCSARTWTDNTGTYSVEAELVEVQGDKVVLRKVSGSVITVPVARLSETDRRYLQSLAEPGSQSTSGDERVYPAFPDAVTEMPPWTDANRQMHALPGVVRLCRKKIFPGDAAHPFAIRRLAYDKPAHRWVRTRAICGTTRSDLL